MFSCDIPAANIEGTLEEFRNMFAANGRTMLDTHLIDALIKDYGDFWFTGNVEAET